MKVQQEVNDNKINDMASDEKENLIDVEVKPQIIEPDVALVKCPTEPTRVKSPEQIVVRSPDPVNWTVPLDTGKTFTVTQNIRGGTNQKNNESIFIVYLFNEFRRF